MKIRFRRRLKSSKAVKMIWGLFHKEKYIKIPGQVSIRSFQHSPLAIFNPLKTRPEYTRAGVYGKLKHVVAKSVQKLQRAINDTCHM